VPLSVTEIRQHLRHHLLHIAANMGNVMPQPNLQETAANIVSQIVGIAIVGSIGEIIRESVYIFLFL